jgi:hypothetical protein
MAKLTLNQIVSQASLEIGITLRPVSAVTGSLDQDIVQMASLLQAVADEVLLDEPYKVTLGDGIWVTGPGGEPKPYPTADGDLILFDGRLAIDGLKFKFLQAKGLEFGEQMGAFVNRQNKLAGRLVGRVLDLDEDVGRVV